MKRVHSISEKTYRNFILLFIEIIIRNEHIKLLHTKCQPIIKSLHERYWPITCKSSVKKIVVNRSKKMHKLFQSKALILKIMRSGST